VTRAAATSGDDGRLSVLVWTRHGRRGAASRLRLLELLPGLRDFGVEATAQSFFADDVLREGGDGGDGKLVAALGGVRRRVSSMLASRRSEVVLIEKEALPFVPWPLEAALLAGARVVVDLGDARFLHHQQHRSRLVRRLLGGKIAALVRRANVVVVGNATLAAWARSEGARDVVVVPTSIDRSRHRPRPADPTRPFTIGWIGSPTTAAYLRPLAPVLGDIARRGLADVHLVGAGRAAPSDLPATAFAWDEATEVERLARFDVGIVPLAHGPWEQAKSPYKLLQYMAMALPVVATPVGAAREIIRHGGNGFLADGDDDWRRTLEQLRTDADLRRRVGLAARRTVEASFSREQVLPVLAAALWRAAARSRGDHRSSS
jgi:glycosyltransferase involved in cell wall biosynthesis